VSSTSSTMGYRKGTGWIMFAALVLILSGIFKIFDAFWAFKYDKDVDPNVQTVFFEHDLSSYGWLWLVIGIILLLAGFAVIRGAQWARWIGIIAAGIATIAYMSWIYFEPFWSLVSMAMTMSVIYALTVYGGTDETA
jgi:hypothetical protein